MSDDAHRMGLSPYGGRGGGGRGASSGFTPFQTPLPYGRGGMPTAAPLPPAGIQPPQHPYPYGVPPGAGPAMMMGGGPPHHQLHLPPPLASPASTSSFLPALLPPDDFSSGGGGGAVIQPPDYRIYVGNISYTANEADVKAAFSQFGPVRSANLRHDDNVGHHKGYCFLDFMDASSAKAAIEATPGSVMIQGKPVRIDRATAPGSTGSSRRDDSAFSGGSGGRGVSAMTMAQKLAQARGLAPAVGSSASSASSSAAPSHSAGSLLLVPPGSASGLQLVPPTPGGSTAVFIEGMVLDPSEVDEELHQDVRSEAVKNGPVVHVQFYKENSPNAGSTTSDGSTAPQKPKINVVIEFASSESAASCVKQMNGRLFAGRTLRSGVMPMDVYRRLKDA